MSANDHLQYDTEAKCKVATLKENTDWDWWRQW
jgi:hypothetical protein